MTTFGLSELHLNKCCFNKTNTIPKLLSFHGLTVLELDSLDIPSETAVYQLPRDDLSRRTLEKLIIYNDHKRIDPEVADLLVYLPSLLHVQLDVCYLSQSPQFLVSPKMKCITARWNMFRGSEQIRSLFQPEVEELNIYNSDVVDFPDLNYSDSKIKILKAGYNTLSVSALNVIVNLPLLEELHLPELHLTQFCIPAFTPKSYISKLVINGNKLDLKCLTEILTLPSLRELNISECDIISIPTIYLSKIMLTRLDVSGNKLDTPTIECVIEFPHLQHLNISNCSNNIYPDQILNKELISVYVTNMFLDPIQPSAKICNKCLYELDYSKCAVDQCTIDYILSIYSLYILNLSGSEIILPLSFTATTHILDLDLSSCNLASVDFMSTLFYIKSLYKLKLIQCKLKTLLFEPSECNIKELYVSWNPINIDAVKQIAKIYSLEIAHIIKIKCDSEHIVSEFLGTSVTNLALSTPMTDISGQNLQYLINVAQSSKIKKLEFEYVQFKDDEQSSHSDEAEKTPLRNWSKLIMSIKSLNELKFQRLDFEVSPKPSNLKNFYVNEQNIIGDELLQWLYILKDSDEVKYGYKRFYKAKAECHLFKFVNYEVKYRVYKMQKQIEGILTYLRYVLEKSSGY